jgi:hypothetical protein
MDPLSATGTLIAVLQISSALISLCYEYRQSTKSATHQIAQISDELNSLKDVLEALLKLVESSSSSEGGEEKSGSGSGSGNGREKEKGLKIFEGLVKEGGPLLSCKGELERLRGMLEPERGWRGVRRTLVWPLKEGEVRKALGALERLKTTMQLALSADQAVVSLGLRDDVEDLTAMFQQQSISE